MFSGIVTDVGRVRAIADAPAGGLRLAIATAYDTGTVALGLGGFASRQTVTAGSSVHIAANEVRDKVLKLAGHMLEAAPEDLEIVDGIVRVAGAPDLSVPIAEVAEAAPELQPQHNQHRRHGGVRQRRDRGLDRDG